MLTGEGTTHRVNDIIVQPQLYGPHLPTAAAPVIEKRKQRTIRQELQPINPYISGERVGPQSLKVHLNPKYFFCLNKSLHLFKTHFAFFNLILTFL